MSTKKIYADRIEAYIASRGSDANVTGAIVKDDETCYYLDVNLNKNMTDDLSLALNRNVEVKGSCVIVKK